MTLIPRAVSGAALAVVLLMAGCASAPEPEPSPSTSPSTNLPTSPPTSTSPSSSSSATPSPATGGPTPPPLSSLTLTTEGLGTLVVGSPVPDQDSSASIVTWDADYCGSLPTPDGNYAGAFIPLYPKVDSSSLGEREVFVVVTTEGNDLSPVSSIRVLTPEVLTAENIGVGSSRAELLEAYPRFDRVTKDHLSDTYSIEGENGQLVFEVAKDTVDPVENYWDEDIVDTVIWITALPAGTPLHALAGGDGGGPCVV